MEIHQILKKFWGYPNFRPLQEDIIQSVLEGQDTLALLPTGGGKSICFQVPALALEGICLVISPLIALMKDQVEQLKRRNIPALAIHSGMNFREIDKTLEQATEGKIKFLYLSPERLKTELFLERLKRMDVSLLAIDEAHCISQWGYDFRPAYLEIADFREKLPKDTKVIALTATATEIVKKDIQKKLAFQKNGQVFQKSFARVNLSYSCFEIENKHQKLLQILRNVQGSAIVYARNRKRTKELADFLQQNKISADFYHAGLSHTLRSAKQERWIQNRVRVIVATNAFGMGIDKADVRVVVHWDLPDTLEAYYQEAGRAGRDEKKAYAVALFQEQNLKDLQKQVELSYPEIPFIKKVYQALANFFNVAVNTNELQSFDFDFRQFRETYELDNISTYHSLKKLSEAGLIDFNESYHNPSRVFIKYPYRDLYDFQLKNPVFEPLLKWLLRMVGGEIFQNFVTIQESEIARVLKVKTELIQKQLQSLQHQQVLIYEKQKEKPQITFLTPRYEAERIPLDKEAIEKRKSRDLGKVKAVGHYVFHQNRCRTQLLLEYFGEISYEKCGVCDICLKQKKNPLQDNQLKATLLNFLRKKPLLPEELVRQIGEKHQKEIAQWIQKLLDVELIEYEMNGKLRIKQG